MVGAILGTIITTLAGSLLWKMALILGIVALIAWLARRIIKGKGDGDPRQPNEIMALIVLIAIAGAAAGLGFGALDRASESVAHANALNTVQAQNQALAADLSAANERAETLRLAAERNRKLADAAEKIADTANAKVAEARRARAALSKQLSRRVENVSRSPDGSTPVVGRDWVHDYNAALGHDVSAPPADPERTGSPTDATRTAGSQGERGTTQLDESRLLEEHPVTTADVLATHITNAEAAIDAATRLEALQRWYQDLRAERNSKQENGNGD